MRDTNKENNPFAYIPVVILAGGKPVLHQASGLSWQNKALIEVNGKPLLWWNLLHYAKHGVRRFLVPAGIQQELFPEMFTHQLGAKFLAEAVENGDKTSHVYQLHIAGQDCEIRLIVTPPEANTAQRLLFCKPWLEDCATFCLTYSDTLSDVNLTEALVFHQTTGLLATVLAAQMPARFRVLGIRHSDYLVRGFAAKPVIQAVPINGGYYFFQSDVMSQHYLGSGQSPLEQAPLEQLAQALQLGAFNHRGAWQHMDGERDLAPLREVARAIDAMPLSQI